MCHIYSRHNKLERPDEFSLGEEVDRFFVSFMGIMHQYASPLYMGWHEGAFHGYKKLSYEAERLRMSFHQALRTMCCASMAKKLVNHFFSGYGASNEADRLIFKLCDMTVKKYVSDIEF